MRNNIKLQYVESCFYMVCYIDIERFLLKYLVNYHGNLNINQIKIPLQYVWIYDEQNKVEQIIEMTLRSGKYI